MSKLLTGTVCESNFGIGVINKDKTPPRFVQNAQLPKLFTIKKGFQVTVQMSLDLLVSLYPLNEIERTMRQFIKIQIGRQVTVQHCSPSAHLLQCSHYGLHHNTAKPGMRQ